MTPSEEPPVHFTTREVGDAVDLPVPHAHRTIFRMCGPAERDSVARTR